MLYQKQEKSDMNRKNGRLEITSRDGSKVLTITEHPDGDGSLQVTAFSKPMNARELRAAAVQLETAEKETARQRAEEKQ